MISVLDFRAVNAIEATISTSTRLPDAMDGGLDWFSDLSLRMANELDDFSTLLGFLMRRMSFSRNTYACLYDTGYRKEHKAMFCTLHNFGGLWYLNAMDRVYTSG